MKRLTYGVIFLSVALGLVGCASIRDVAIATLDQQYQEWVDAGGLAASVSNYLSKAEAEITPPPEVTPPSTATPATGDGVAFSQFNWVYGGFNSSGAKINPGDPVISNLRYSANGLSFKYDVDLAAWGRSAGDHLGALACLFVQRADGSWVGGKFDWISSSRSTRDFINVHGGYNGWRLSDVPNPCNAAFVIINVNDKQRSNVLVSKWSR